MHNLEPSQSQKRTFFLSGTEQVELLKKGSIKRQLIRPATLGDGILSLSKQQELKYRQFFIGNVRDTKITRFVPASGAATRMFKDVYQAISGEPNEKTQQLIQNKNKLPFYENWKQLVKDGSSDLEWFVALVHPEKLNLAALPKALIPFHKYGGEKRGALEEHFIEAARTMNLTSPVCLHFTVSENHKERINDKLKQIAESIGLRLGVEFKFELSVQNPDSDTVCLNEVGDLLCDESGKEIKRPAGHGALLENLSTIDADLIFIKNIDNVCREEYQIDSIKYKQVLGGMLLQLKNEIHQAIRVLRKGRITDDEITEIHEKAKNEWNIHLPEEFDLNEWIRMLNKPIRVCGMVENKGDKGGGPFWIQSGEHSMLQIVEKDEINSKDEEQKAILNASSHFNPVDLVVFTKDVDGNTFDLADFSNPSACFISKKHINNQHCTIIELPGLWNGGMEHWISVFVEVPSITFNPVKSIVDLLKETHQ